MPMNLVAQLHLFQEEIYPKVSDLYTETLLSNLHIPATTNEFLFLQSN